MSNTTTIPHEQYLELPRAIADANGVPQKGQKSSTTSFHLKKYGEEVISPKFQSMWLPHSVILEGMFLINTTPLRIHSCMIEYTNFVLARHAAKYLRAGILEVHIVFDDPGRFDMHPKDIERNRHDAGKQSALHEHIHFDDRTKIPSKWREMLGCRKCKRDLVEYVGDCVLRIAPRYLNNGQTLIVGGACDSTERDQAWSTTENAVEQPEPCYFSNAEEADTRVWLHAKHSYGQRKLIYSPDTDVYHIGLTSADLALHDVIIQLSPVGHEIKLLHLNKLESALKLDPELHSIPIEKRSEIMQVVYVCTGCDFTSFFSGIGKVTFLKAFYRYASFITAPGQHNAGPLADISPDSEGYLAFVRLVGVAYFTKHLPAFQKAQTPVSHFESYYIPNMNVEEHHKKWYEGLRESIWERITFEDQLPPSLDALKLHWLRCLWVIDYWRQAHHNNITLLPMEWFGWVTGSSTVQVEWDSPENMHKTRQTVAFLTHGCACKTGCSTTICKCVKSGQLCGPGCTCARSTECQNKRVTEEDTSAGAEELEVSDNSATAGDSDCSDIYERPELQAESTEAEDD